MDTERIERAAELIAGWRRGQIPMPELPQDAEPTSEDEAYAIQADVHTRLERSLGRVAGYKIGCTTKVMQDYLKIPQPCAGGILEKNVFLERAGAAASDYLELGVECEIAAYLTAPLSPENAPYTRDSAGECVGAFMAAMELVDDRYANFPTFGVNALIADDFFNAGVVLARPVNDWRSLDLAALKGSMTINETLVGEGTGADILGHPLEALAWLANRYAKMGWSVPKGTFVLLGSVVQTHWVSPGDSVVCTIEGLGETTLRVV